MSVVGDTRVLDGLAEIPWRDLSHAGSIWHQGSVYPATEYAVPFLARLAAAGVAPRDLVGLLGFIAESRDYRSAPPGAARAAVAAEAALPGPPRAQG